jgi:thiamine-monophosphate kinase
MDEFDFIKKYFQPLTSSIGRKLQDDAAVYRPEANKEIVITTDSLVEGIHFFGSENPKHIAQKALRVNLSDIASMGAVPLFYNLAINIPKKNVKLFLPKFVEGLKADQETFNIQLIGGDLTSSRKDIHITVTMFGHIPFGEAVGRNTAKDKDDLYVTGKLGLSKIGLENFFSKSILFNEAKKKYLLPNPRVKVGILLRKIVNSMIDISDGLVQDSSHLAFNSGLCLEIDLNSLPISFCYPISQHVMVDYALYGGDDYELLFSCNPNKIDLIKQLSLETNIEFTKIGKFYKCLKPSLRFKDSNIIPKKLSYNHF